MYGITRHDDKDYVSISSCMTHRYKGYGHTWWMDGHIEGHNLLERVTENRNSPKIK